MSSSYLSSIAKQILSRALFFGSVRAQKGQGAMRAAKGIFRTVQKPFGQVDARPSKSYRISWIGVCSRAAPRTTPLIFLYPLSEVDPKQLDVNCWISFHRGIAAAGRSWFGKWLKCAHYAH